MASPREYREHLYRLRTHPEEAYGDNGFVDRRDSFLTVYLTIIPFAGVEYIAEKASTSMPHGLIFPVGYLLFWAFYYTYYKPGMLEERLSSTSSWTFRSVLSVLLGVMIWFVKVTVVELSQILLLRWIIGPGPRSPVPRSKDAFRRVTPPATPDPSGGYREFTGSWNVGESPLPRNDRESTFSGTRSGAGSPAKTTEGTYAGLRPGAPRREATFVGPRAAPPPLGVPPDIKAALLILGLPEKVAWEQVHRRYRELAKKYHPDLNQDRTEAGRHFVRIDAAYRRLSSVRARYFPEKQRASG